MKNKHYYRWGRKIPRWFSIYSPMNAVTFGLIIPLGKRWKSYSTESTTTVWPALFPPWNIRQGKIEPDNRKHISFQRELMTDYLLKGQCNLRKPKYLPWILMLYTLHNRAALLSPSHLDCTWVISPDRIWISENRASGRYIPY